MRRLFRGLDAKTIAMLIVAAVVAVSIWQIVERGNQVNDLISQRGELEQDAAADRRSAAQDRVTAAENQRALLAYTATLAARQDALLAYLRAHGIQLPQRLVTVVPAPRIVVRHPRASHHVKRRAAPGGRSSTAPTGPGKSGHAPGHTKHPRHGRRRH